MNDSVYCILAVSRFVIKISYAFTLFFFSSCVPMCFFSVPFIVSKHTWLNIFPIEQCAFASCKLNAKWKSEEKKTRCNHCRHPYALHYSLLRNRLQIRADALCFSLSFSRIVPFVLSPSLFALSSFGFYGIRFHFLLFLSDSLQFEMYVASLMRLLLGFFFFHFVSYPRLVYIFVIGCQS